MLLSTILSKTNISKVPLKFPALNFKLRFWAIASKFKKQAKQLSFFFSSTTSSESSLYAIYSIIDLKSSQRDQPFKFCRKNFMTFCCYEQKKNALKQKKTSVA